MTQACKRPSGEQGAGAAGAGPGPQGAGAAQAEPGGAGRWIKQHGAPHMYYVRTSTVGRSRNVAGGSQGARRSS